MSCIVHNTTCKPHAIGVYFLSCRETLRHFRVFSNLAPFRCRLFLLYVSNTPFIYAFPLLTTNFSLFFLYDLVRFSFCVCVSQNINSHACLALLTLTCIVYFTNVAFSGYK